MYKLIVRDRSGNEVEHVVDRPVVLGRKTPADIVLPGKIVSSRHARIHLKGDKIAIEDMQSANGTYVNRKRISKPMMIRPSDVIHIGEFEMRIEAGGPSRPAQDARSAASAQPAAKPKPKPAAEPLVPDDEEPPAGARVKGEGSPSPPSPFLDDDFFPPDSEPADEPKAEPKAVAPAAARTASAPARQAAESVQFTDEDLFVEDSAAEPAPLETATDDGSGAVHQSEPERVEAAAEPSARNLGEEYSYLIVFLEPVKEFLLDDNVSEIMINAFDDIWVEKKGKLYKTKAKFKTDMALEAAIKNIARSVGRRVDELDPRLDARLPDGSRVHAIIPPCARRGACLDIRKFARDTLTMQKLIDFGSLTEHSVAFLRASVEIARNVVVSGGTGSGKTSLLNAVSSLIPDDQRIITVEDAAELQLQQEHLVSLETRMADKKGKGEVTIRHLLHSCLRLRPDRIVIGEVRGGEALDLLQAMNTGHGGSMTTIHANSPMDALSRLETCALMSGVELPHKAIKDQIASAIDLVVYTARLSDGSRKVTAITEILDLDERGNYKINDIFLFKRKGRDDKGRILGSLDPTGNLPTYLQEIEHHGIKLPAGMFDGN